MSRCFPKHAPEVTLLHLSGLFPETFAGFNHPETLAKDMPCIDTSYQVVRKPRHPESYRQAQQRCAEVVHALAEQHPGESILLVTHGLCLEYMVSTGVPLGGSLGALCKGVLP